MCCPPAVNICGRLYSISTSSRNHRCLVYSENNLWICLHPDCKDVRAAYTVCVERSCSVTSRLCRFCCVMCDRSQISCGHYTLPKSCMVYRCVVQTPINSPFHGLLGHLGLGQTRQKLWDRYNAAAKKRIFNYILIFPCGF